MKSTTMKVMMDIFFFVSKTGIYPDNPSKQINILLSTHRPPHWDFSVGNGNRQWNTCCKSTSNYWTYQLTPRKQSSWLFTSLTEELNSGLQKQHQLVVIWMGLNLDRNSEGTLTTRSCCLTHCLPHSVPNMRYKGNASFHKLHNNFLNFFLSDKVAGWV